ncbi:MAG: sensor histidine kinase [Elusimicrobiaceae bacterium]|nr:sensor histidine kinase [Elusimicrobiaceae bacterium]
MISQQDDTSRINTSSLWQAREEAPRFCFVAYIQACGSRKVVLDSLPGYVSKHIFTGIHTKKIKEALGGKCLQYEWSDPKGPSFYQTSLVSFPAKDKKDKPSVLMTVQDISSWGRQASSVPVDSLRENHSRRITMAQLLIAAREAEKKEISKALHDEIGSAAVIFTSLVSVTKMYVQKEQKMKSLEKLHELDCQIKESIGRLKNIVVSLRPPSLEQDGALCGAIGELLDNCNDYFHIPFSFEYDPMISEVGITDKVKIMLYRVVQEALNNVVKHAHAHQIRVALRRDKDMLYFEVCDDGVGFSVAAQKSIRHIGLLAMRDSVHLLGGSISIRSTKGRGTFIEGKCPCAIYEGGIE